MTRIQEPETGSCSNLDGILIVNKPPDISSARVVSVVKRALKAGKVGHAGTLDPFAEGVLICCINQATRLAGFLMHGTKRYVATLKLGQDTDTQDQTGSVVSTTDSVDYSRQTIQSVIESFGGDIEQLPPVYSALKHQGVPLYKLARSGKPVQKPARRVHVYEIDIKGIELPYVRFEVTCSAGTYIRTLGADIGKKLGCGGHLVALRRIESSGFRLDQAISLSELEELVGGRQLQQKMIPMKDALPDVPDFCVDDGLVEKIRHGQKISLLDLSGSNIAFSALQKGQILKIVDREDDLIAILTYNATEEHLKYCCVFQK